METKIDAVLRALVRGESLSVVSALRDYHTTELRCYVARIRKRLPPELEIVTEKQQDASGNLYNTYKLRRKENGNADHHHA